MQDGLLHGHLQLVPGSPGCLGVRSHRGLELRCCVAPGRPAFLGVRLGVRFLLLRDGGTFQHDQIFRDVDCHGRIVNGSTDNRPKPRRSGRRNDIRPDRGFPLHQQPLILRLALR